MIRSKIKGDKLYVKGETDGAIRGAKDPGSGCKNGAVRGAKDPGSGCKKIMIKQTIVMPKTIKIQSMIKKKKLLRSREGTSCERGRPSPGSNRTSVHRQGDWRKRQVLLPAERALSKLEEVDPLHEELDEVINRRAIAHLGAMRRHVMDNEFGTFLTEGLEEKMSSYAKCMKHRGIGQEEPEAYAGDKVNNMQEKRMRRAIKKIVHRGAGVPADGKREQSQEDIKAALEDAGWGTTTPSPNVGDEEASRRISAQAYVQRQIDKYAEYGTAAKKGDHFQDPGSTEFTGLGYKATISDYISRRFEDNTKTTTPKLKEMSRKETRRGAREVRESLRTGPGADFYLAISPFQHTANAAAGGTLSCPESLPVDEDTYAIVDSGTTITITNLKEKTMFESFDHEKRVKIKGFNGSVSRSRGSGTIAGYTVTNSGKTVAIRIPNAHQVDDAPHELISVSSMVKSDYEFHFTEEEAYIISPEREKIILLEKSGLYWLKMRRAVGPAATAGLARTPLKELTPEAGESIDDIGSNDPSLSEQASTIGKCEDGECERCNLTLRTAGKTVPLRLMHQRLNHFSEDLIVKMSKLGSLDVNVIGKKAVCDICRTAKATRNSIPKTRDLVDDQLKPFQRVWTDLKGKVTKDIWGNQYVVTFTCETTRWTWVGFMKRKSEAKDQYLKFLKWVKLEKFKVEELNSDGGGEFTASENAKVISAFQKISEEWGVKQNFTCAHTPEQNGVSERLNRKLVEAGRSLLIQAGLGAEMWSLAVAHAVFIMNRMWHKRHQISENMGASPYQVLYGATPRTTNFRVWGCDAWKLDNLHRSSSWTRKASKQIFVGMSAKRKGWVLLDPKTRKLSTSYHVTFDEDMTARRCALRDFDLRQTKKAGPGATADDEREAKLERSMYDESPDLRFEDSVDKYVEDAAADAVRGVKDPGSAAADDEDATSSEEEAQGSRKRKTVRGAKDPGRTASDDDHDATSSEEEAQDQMTRTNEGERASRRASSSRPTSSSAPSRSTRETMETPFRVPVRRAAIGAPQEIMEEDMLFLRKAMEIDLPLVFQQRNPKQAQTSSRQRYEGYKKARTLREAKTLKASWADLVWDYGRGWIDFSSAASSNAVLNELIMDDYLRTVNDSAAAYVNQDGHPSTADKFSSLCFEESVQQDYAMIGMEVIEALSHRARRILTSALGGQTLTEFAHCCASRIIIPTPLTVAEAMASEHKMEWEKAMQEEIDTLNRFHCFDVVPKAEALRHGRLVKSKWVFKLKMESDGSLQRFKARLVAKGFTQQYGVDYDETYSPVFGYSSLRSILAKAANEDLQLTSWDLASSFIQQKLDVEHMYMECPAGYDKFMSDGTTPAALHCLQSIYGLKQSSRLLHDRLSKYLKSLGFKQLISDKCVFVRGSGADICIVATWVDDIIMANARKNKLEREKFDKDLRKEFEMSPWTTGEADWLLNMTIKRDWVKGTLHLSQPLAIEKMAEKFDLMGREGSNPYIPMKPDLKLVKAEGDKIIPESVFPYQSMVGGLLYLSLTARPDVAQSVSVLSRFMSCPGKEHCEAAEQIVKYLYGTKDYGITYTRNGKSAPHLEKEDDMPLIQTYVHSRKNKTAIDDPTGDSQIMGTYADADLAGDVGTRKSTSGYCIVMNGGVVHWSSKLQATVALSTAEAETIAATEAVKQLMHMRLFHEELGMKSDVPSTVFEDNVACISLAHGSQQSKRAKHYQLKVHFLNEKFKDGTFAFEKVGTADQLSDALTKSLPRETFCRFRDWMGVLPPPD